MFLYCSMQQVSFSALQEKEKPASWIWFLWWIWGTLEESSTGSATGSSTEHTILCTWTYYCIGLSACGLHKQVCIRNTVCVFYCLFRSSWLDHSTVSLRPVHIMYYATGTTSRTWLRTQDSVHRLHRVGNIYRYMGLQGPLAREFINKESSQPEHWLVYRIVVWGARFVSQSVTMRCGEATRPEDVAAIHCVWNIRPFRLHQSHGTTTATTPTPTLWS